MLIKTDGTERMWFLNPETLEEDSFIETYTNKRKAEKLNELEFVERENLCQYLAEKLHSYR